MGSQRGACMEIAFILNMWIQRACAINSGSDVQYVEIYAKAQKGERNRFENGVYDRVEVTMVGEIASGNG